MTNLKKTLAAAGLLVAGFSFTSVPALAEGRVALLVGPTQDAFIGTWAQAFEKKASANDFSVSVFSSPFDPALQARQIDDAIGQKFDLLVIQPISQKAIVPAATRAHDANIPVVTIVSEPQSDMVPLSASYIGENSYVLGQQAGVAMAQALREAGKENGKVAAITGSMAEGIAPVRMQGFTDALKDKLPDAEIVAIEDVSWNPVAGEQAAGQLLARFAAQGGIDGIYGMNDTLANSAIQAARTAGVSLGGGKGELTVVGGNCQAPGMRNLQRGAMTATVLMLPVASAERAADVAKAVLAGESVDAKYYEDHKIISTENADQYTEACSY